MDETKDTEESRPIGIARRFGREQMEHYGQLFQFAKSLEQAGCLPTAKGKSMSAGEAWIAMTAGYDLGLSPQVALSQIIVVNGRSRIYSELGLALVRASGLLVGEPLIEYLGDGQTDESGCRVTLQRRGSPPVVSTFTVRDARRAGLLGKPGPWTEYPRRMFRARALGFLLHDLFGDVLAGVGFVEEAEEPQAPTPSGGPAGTTDPLLALPEHTGASVQENGPRETPGEAPSPSAPTPERPKPAPEAPVQTVSRPAAQASQAAPTAAPVTAQAQAAQPAQPVPVPAPIPRPVEPVQAGKPQEAPRPSDVDAAGRRVLERDEKGEPLVVAKPPTPEQWKADAEAQVAAREAARANVGSPAQVPTPVKAVPPGEAAVAAAGKAGDLSDADKVKAALQAAKDRAAARAAKDQKPEEPKNRRLFG